MGTQSTWGLGLGLTRRESNMKLKINDIERTINPEDTLGDLKRTLAHEEDLVSDLPTLSCLGYHFDESFDELKIGDLFKDEKNLNMALPDAADGEFSTDTDVTIIVGTSRKFKTYQLAADGVETIDLGPKCTTFGLVRKTNNKPSGQRTYELRKYTMAKTKTGKISIKVVNGESKVFLDGTQEIEGKLKEYDERNECEGVDADKLLDRAGKALKCAYYFGKIVKTFIIDELI